MHLCKFKSQLYVFGPQFPSRRPFVCSIAQNACKVPSCNLLSRSTSRSQSASINSFRSWPTLHCETLCQFCFESCLASRSNSECKMWSANLQHASSDFSNNESSSKQRSEICFWCANVGSRSDSKWVDNKTANTLYSFS